MSPAIKIFSCRKVHNLFPILYGVWGLNVVNKPDSEHWMSKYYNIYFLVEKVQILQ